MTEFETRSLLAEGRLDWPKGERHTERFGVINIQTAGRNPEEYAREQLDEFLARTAAFPGQGVTRQENDPTAEHADFTSAPIGMFGRLIVEVTEIEDSEEEARLGSKIPANVAEVGDELVLGTGELFTEEDEGIVSIGINPADGRETEWLDVANLRSVHRQMVKLFFEPVE